MKRLFIIGNGFDISHGLPTKFNPDFKRIAEYREQDPYFWNIYQSRKADIWSDFENCLANPDFNSLESIFDDYAPDYYSDHERDRTAIITQVDLNGNLIASLYEFANQAEYSLNSALPLSKYSNYFVSSDLFVNFNYTHTLEELYGIDRNQVLHIHGEVGSDNLLLGYPEGQYQPEKYYYDVRQKGRGPYKEVDIETHIEDMFQGEVMDYYTYTAYSLLINKTKSFSKAQQTELLKNFLKNLDVQEIIVLGHSCAIDFPYFEYLNNVYPFAQWDFSPFDDETKYNAENLIAKIGIKNYQIN